MQGMQSVQYVKLPGGEVNCFESTIRDNARTSSTFAPGFLNLSLYIKPDEPDEERRFPHEYGGFSRRVSELETDEQLPNPTKRRVRRRVHSTT